MNHCRCNHCPAFHRAASVLCAFCAEHCPHTEEDQGSFIEGFLGVQRWHAHRAQAYLDDLGIDAEVHAATLMRGGMDAVEHELRILKECRALDRAFVKSLDRER